MTEWIQWNGGECPIPDAKDGEYVIKLRDGTIYGCADPHYFDWSHAKAPFDIIAYRLIEKEQSDLDGLEGEIKNLVNSIDMQNTWWVRRNDVLDLIKKRKEAKL